MSWLGPDQVHPRPSRTDLRIWGSVAVLCVLALYIGQRATGLGPEWLKKPATDWHSWIEIAATIGAAMVVVLGVLRLRLIVWYRKVRGVPGVLAFPADKLKILSAVLRNDGHEFRASTVPEHDPEARPATSAANLHLGDALLSVPSQVTLTVRRFVSAPRHRLAVQESVLLVLGGPGSGKSVLLQELHATLAQGVALSHHSLLPLLIFARDLSLELLNQARLEGMAWLLTKLYEERKARSYEPRINTAIELLRHEWFRVDALVIVDGLDEIPPRRMVLDENGAACSEYELIHQRLAALIAEDTKSKSVVHRYVLSCRVDEDVGRFPGAAQVLLPELDERARTRLVAALSRRASRSSWIGRVMARPFHLYDRSPYFLALLCGHARDKDEHRSHVLSFDDLMRSYLRREVLRNYSGRGLAERRSFVERCELVSRIAVEWLAFDMTASKKGGNLYAEIPLEAGLTERFVRDIIRLQSGPVPTTRLAATSKLLALCLTGPVEERALARELRGYLDRDDIHIFTGLAGHPIDAKAIGQALDGISDSGVEVPAWYADVAATLATHLKGKRDAASRLATLIFIRGIFAAHALRIVQLVLVSGRLQVRFRHRRLAEYFAACYLRDRWSELEKSLPPARDAPWISPVLNLTCAMQDDDCPAVNRLAQEFDQTPDQPVFLWRYAFEAVVEGISFSNDGPARRAATTLTLQRAAGRFCATDAGSLMVDPISQIAVLAALDTLERAQVASSEFTPFTPDQREQLLEAVRRLPHGWVNHRISAISAIHALSGQAMSLVTRGMRLLHILAQPGDYLAFIPNSADRPALFGAMARLSVLAGELLMLGLVLAAYLLVHGRVVHEWPASAAVMVELRPWFSVLIGSTWILLRIRSHISSPRYARNTAVALTKLIASCAALPLAVVSAPFLIAALGTSRAVRVICYTAAGLRPLGLAFIELRRSFVVVVAIGVVSWLFELFLVLGAVALALGMLGGALALVGVAAFFVLQLLGVSTQETQAIGQTPTPVEQRPKVTPSDPAAQAIREQDIATLAGILCSPPPVLAVDPTRWQALYASARVRTEQRHLTRLREVGKNLTSREVTSHCEPGITPLNDDLVVAIDSRLENGQRIESVVQDRNAWTLGITTLSALVASLVGAFGLTLLRQSRLRSEFARLPQRQDIASLCGAVIDESRLEPVRLEAIRRLGASDISAKDLSALEQALSELSRRASRDAVIEAQLAMVIRGLSNRLRHRSAEGREQVARTG
jgi:NACHT domain-containing protein